MDNVHRLNSPTSDHNLVKIQFSEGMEEMYFERTRVINGNRQVEVQHYFDGVSQTAKENAILGGYHFHINDQQLFLNYAEMLDLYVLLTRIYQKDEPIDKITELK